MSIVIWGAQYVGNGLIRNNNGYNLMLFREILNLMFCSRLRLSRKLNNLKQKRSLIRCFSIELVE